MRLYYIIGIILLISVIGFIWSPPMDIRILATAAVFWTIGIIYFLKEFIDNA